MISEVQSKCRIRGRSNFMSMSTMNGNKNPKEGRPTGLRRGGKMA